jgi:hypothetical protein
MRNDARVREMAMGRVCRAVLPGGSDSPAGDHRRMEVVSVSNALSMYAEVD